MKRVRRGAVAGALVVVALSGCADSDSPVESTGGVDATAAAAKDNDPSIGKAEFTRRANRICKRGGDRLRVQLVAFEHERGVKPNASMSRRQEEEFVKYVVVPAVQGQADGVIRLPVPAGEEGNVQALVNALQNVVDRGAEDPASILPSVSGGGPLAKVNEVAREYGVEECEQP